MTAFNLLPPSNASIFKQLFYGLWWGLHAVRYRAPPRISATVWLYLAILKALAVFFYALGRMLASKSPKDPPRSPSSFLALSEAACEKIEDGPSLPGVAVVVPVFMRESGDATQMVKLLHALISQTLQPDLIVFLDDVSPVSIDPACWNSVLESLETRSNIILRRLPHNVGPAAARNSGLKVVTQESPQTQVVCFTDLDCLPTKSWTEAMAAAQKACPAVYSGITLAVDRNSTIGMYHDVFGTLNGRLVQHADSAPSWQGSLLYGPTCNLSAPIRIAAALEFDPSFRAASMEDVDFCLRATTQAGLQVELLRKARVFHAYDQTLLGFCRQFFKYGHWEDAVTAKHAIYPPLLAHTVDISSV